MFVRTFAAMAALVLLGSGCAVAPRGSDVPLPSGPPVQNASTPYDTGLQCIKGEVRKQGAQYTLAVGEIADRTGKFNFDSGNGYYVTQGAGDVLSSAFYGVVNLVERLDTSILEWELDKANQKILGDAAGPRTVNGETYYYRPIQAGGIVGSDYYIVGSINSLDLAITSAGASLYVQGVGAGARQFRLLVGLDLRVVETRTGRVVAASSVNKQIVGDEVSAGIGRFFGTTLVEFDMGQRQNEPLHFALRAMLQYAAMDLLAQLYPEMNAAGCYTDIAALERGAAPGQQASPQPATPATFQAASTAGVTTPAIAPTPVKAPVKVQEARKKTLLQPQTP